MKLLLVLSLLAVTVADENWLTPTSSSCPCGRIYIPVCASNGVTYNNMCEFGCAFEKSGGKIYVKKHGRCDERDEPPYVVEMGYGRNPPS